MNQDEIVKITHNMIQHGVKTFGFNVGDFLMDIQPNKFQSEDFYIQSKSHPFTDNPIPPFIQFVQVDHFSFKMIQNINENNCFSIEKEFIEVSKLDIMLCLTTFFRLTKKRLTV